MSDTPMPTSLDALFVKQADHPQANGKGAEEENKAQPQPTNDQTKQNEADNKQESNEPAAKVETAEEKLAKAEKRLKDTQDWANQQRREAIEAKKKLQELGGLSAEEEHALAALEKEVEDPLQQAMNDFWTRYAPVAEYLKVQGENPEEAIEAFKLVANNNKPLLEEFMQLKPEERVPWVLSKGREHLTVYSAVKEHGSLDRALVAIQQQAEQAALEKLRQQSGTAEESAKTQKATPKLSGSYTPSTEEYRRKSLGDLMK